MIANGKSQQTMVRNLLVEAESNGICCKQENLITQRLKKYAVEKLEHISVSQLEPAPGELQSYIYFDIVIFCC